MVNIDKSGIFMWQMSILNTNIYFSMQSPLRACEREHIKNTKSLRYRLRALCSREKGSGRYRGKIFLLKVSYI